MNNSVEELYHRVINIANYFLESAKQFSIQELKGQDDPTFEEVAKLARLLSATLSKLADLDAWDDARIALNAEQYSHLMEGMALAISAEDEESLKYYREKLENSSFV